MLIKKYIVYTIGLILCGLFLNWKMQTKDYIRKVSFEITLPVMSLNNNAQMIYTPFKDTVTIYYDSSYIVYTKSYFHTDIDVFGDVIEEDADSTLKSLSGTFKKTDSVTKPSVHSAFFGYLKGENYGMLYYPFGRQATKQRVDTMKIQWGGESFKSFLTLENKKLVDRRVTKNRITEKYVTIDKKDETYPDSIFVDYSSAIEGEIFSFNQELEKENKMKISQIVMLFKKSYSEMYAAILPERKLSVRMLDSKISNYDEISEIFNKYRKNKF